MIGCLPTQAIAFEWKPGFSVKKHDRRNQCVIAAIWQSTVRRKLAMALQIDERLIRPASDSSVT